MPAQNQASASPEKPKEYLILIHDGSTHGRKRLNHELEHAQKMLAVTIRKVVKSFRASSARLMVYMHASDSHLGKTFHVGSVEELCTDLFPRISGVEMKEGDKATFMLAAAPEVEQQIVSALQGQGGAAG